ncbi:MAG: DUF1700 domain-containing protein [Acetatifactor sp.]|nr:DUF1700 domain-containing protein [Acetatifactor sp.]
MNKQEFIDRLRAALNGRIPAPEVEEMVNYYQDYINMEMRKGKSQEEVLKALGDPRLIARTIIQTNGGSDTAYGAQGDGYQSNSYQNTGHREAYQRENYQNYRNDNRSSHRMLRMPGWLLAILIMLVAILVIGIVFSVLSFLAPLIIVMMAVVLMIKLFRDWLN